MLTNVLNFKMTKEPKIPRDNNLIKVHIQKLLHVYILLNMALSANNNILLMRLKLNQKKIKNFYNLIILISLIPPFFIFYLK